jgi:hypothetical protein
MTDPRDMTTGEAEAFRRGWEAAREAIAALGAAFGCDLDNGGEYDGRDWVRELVVNIRAMEPPA